MREVAVFYAYDDTEFFDREECLAYEQEALDCFTEINEKYSFFDRQMNLYCAPLSSTDIDDWADWLSNAAENCEFIYREENLSITAEDLINKEWGFGIINEDFHNKVGWFRYNYRINEWDKVDD